MAHTAGAALRLGVDEAKFDAIWEFRTSPLYTEAERVALDFAIAAASQPNDVTDELMDRMKQHWDEGQIVESINDLLKEPLVLEFLGLATPKSTRSLRMSRSTSMVSDTTPRRGPLLGVWVERGDCY